MAPPLLRRLRRSWPLVIGGLIVVLLVAQALRPDVHEVELADVGRDALRVTLDEDARTRWRDTFVLTAPVPGTLSRVRVEPGDRVARGEVIATLEPGTAPLLDARTRASLQAELEAARAALGRARAEEDAAAALARQAEADLARMRPLQGVGAVSRADLELLEVQEQTARQRHAAATFAVRVAEHQVEAARAALRADAGGQGGTGAATIRLTAPVDGIVLRRPRVSAGVVQAGEPIVEIGDPSTLEVVADYLSTEAVRLAPGMPVLVDGWNAAGTVLQGRVRRIEPGGFTKVSALGVEEQRVNVIVVPTEGDPAWDSLGDGYRVRTRAIVWEGEDVLTVPFGSLFRVGDEWAVFVVEDGRAMRRTVQIGHQTDTAVQVVDGLREGAHVIVHPSDQISDGTAVVGVRS